MTTDSFIDAGSLRVRYRREGSGPNVVLVHGVGGSLEDWNGVSALLTERYTVLRMDLRGHGQSDKPAGPYELEHFVQDLHALTKAVNIDHFSLVGFSLGGIIAQGYAQTFSSSLDRLVLLSTVAGRTEDEKRRVLERLEIVASGIPGQHFENSIGRWFTEKFQRENPDIMAAYARRSQKNDPAAYAAAYRVLAMSDLGDRLAEIRVPTLIATGEEDQGSNPRMARLMHDRIAGSQLKIFAELRHSILTEAPRLVADTIIGFLSNETKAKVS